MLRNLELPKQHRYCSLYFWHLLTEHFFSFHRSNKKYDYLRHKDKELDGLIKCNVNAPWWILTEAVVMSHWLVKKINKMQNDHHSLFSPKKEMEAIRRNQSTREQRVRRHVLIHRQLLVAQTQSRTSTSPADVERRCTFFFFFFFPYPHLHPRVSPLTFPPIFYAAPHCLHCLRFRTELLYSLENGLPLWMEVNTESLGQPGL